MSSPSLTLANLASEYKFLLTHCPTGVLLVPTPNPLIFTGSIFLRRGAYQNSIYKFRVELPEGYNGPGKFPEVYFEGVVPFNPMVRPSDGFLDVESGFYFWNEGEMKDKCYLVSLLTYVKKVFYIKRFGLERDSVEIGILGCQEIDRGYFANMEAARLFVQDREEYDRRLMENVRESQEKVYEDGGSWKFFSRRGVEVKDLIKEGAKGDEILEVVKVCKKD
ncbi:hypothetical protein TrST_g9018 [Triparma strigata]|uniref:UBC core domain-containing protein n=1 Tax=Triparma strigata TaxID=1606541 RepID=A0A9W7BL92_9STRA|nr:hypothetical protein TrST_g9018 [Triparma strigata]